VPKKGRKAFGPKSWKKGKLKGRPPFQTKEGPRKFGPKRRKGIIQFNKMEGKN